MAVARHDVCKAVYAKVLSDDNTPLLPQAENMTRRTSVLFQPVRR